jgi:hypothetical protein
MLIAAAIAVAVPVLWMPAAGAAPARSARVASDPYGNGHTSSTEPPAAVSPASESPTTVSATHHSNGLPFTGGDVLGLTFIGIGLVLMGTALPGSPRRRGRRRDLPADS